MRLLKLLAASALASEAHFLRKAGTPETPAPETPAAPDAKKLACTGAVTAVCLKYKDGTKKDLKKTGSDDDKKNACKAIEDQCGKGKKGEEVTNTPDNLMAQGVCAKEQEQAAEKDAYKTADDFCHGSCASC